MLAMGSTTEFGKDGDGYADGVGFLRVAKVVEGGRSFATKRFRKRLDCLSGDGPMQQYANSSPPLHHLALTNS